MSLEELPNGWTETKLGDVIEYGKVSKAEPQDIQPDTWVLELEDIEKNSSKLLGKFYFSDRQSKSTKNRFKKGDVLYGKLRPYLSKIVLANDDGVCTTEIIPISETDFIKSKYLFYWLKSSNFKEYVDAVSYGVNMPRLGTQDGLNAPLVFAPLAEQQQIAEKLDELLAQVDRLKARLDAIPSILKSFRQSVLAAAVSGGLTEEWRKNNICTENDLTQLNVFRGVELTKLPEGWKWVRFDSVAEIASNLKNPLDTPDAVHIAPNHIESNTGRIIELSTIKMDGVTSAKHEFRSGQIIYSKIRPYLCKVTIVDFNGLCSADMYPINSKINTQYLFRWMLTPKFTQWASNAESRSVLPKINQNDLSKIPVPVPSLEEQAEIIRCIEHLFAYADQIEQRVKDAQTRVNSLTQSILAKAFRGELTAEWREQNPDLISGENSAAALLDRIKAERAAQANAKKPRGKTKAKAS